MNPKRLVVYESKTELVRAAAQLLAGAIRETLEQKEICRFSLAGGSTPGPAYAALADPAIVGRLPFERIEILFGDERCVPADDPESNFAMAMAAFGPRFSEFKAVHRIQGEMEKNAAAAANEAVLQEPVDVMLLGMGPDCHVASLFPGSIAFQKEGTLATAVSCPKPPPWRITVSPEVITAAKNVFVLATGGEKAAALNAVFSAPVDPMKRPAQLVLDATWLVDGAAASKLFEIGS